jgi:hypothetical protein
MKKILFTGFCFLLALIGNSVVLAQDVFVAVPDSTAGKDVVIIASGLVSGEPVSFDLLRPDQTEIQFQSTADEWGRVKTSIFGIHVRKAGHYQLVLQGEYTGQKATSFIVLPEVFSPYRSEVSLKNASVPADGKTTALLEVTLRDVYGNKISGKPVKVFSSRNGDAVVANPSSDTNGKVSVKVSSLEPGVSTISVLADEVLLQEKPEIIFFLDGKGLPENVGASGDLGSYLKAQLFEDPVAENLAAYFVIEGIESTVMKGESLTFRVDVKDKDGNPVPDYTGAIRFSSSDDRAKLPSDYTFTIEDQGSHTFYLALSLGTVGSHTLAVHDLADFRLSGEFKFQVAEEEGPVIIADKMSVSITQPTAGAKFSSSRLTIMGETVDCSVVKLMDGPTILIENLAVNDSQSYLYQTPSLADGWHEFQAICVLDETVVSEKVRIQVDRSAPSVLAVRLEPSDPLMPGEEFQMFVGGGEELSCGKAVVNEVEVKFNPLDSKTYVATLKAPMKQGEYPFSATICDLMGNVLEEQNAGVIVVGNCKVDPDCDLGEICVKGFCQPDPNFCRSDEDCPEGQTCIDGVCESKPMAPTAVTNLTASNGEIEKSTLLWSPAEDDEGIANYRVNYALCEAGKELNMASQVPDDRTQWYIDGLQECRTYCFQVTATDVRGNEGAPSEVAEGTPFCPEPIHEAAPKTTDSGGGTPVWLGLVAMLFGIGAVFVVRGVRH